MISIICVGKMHEKFYKEAQKEYEKRLSKYVKLQIIECNDINNSNKDIVLKKESELILKNLNLNSYIITLEIEGNMLNSIDLSNKIDKIFLNNPNITFIIGGSYGISDNIKKLSNYKLSFSKMTFPHQLFRIILLEQIYRIYKILNNETYHK